MLNRPSNDFAVRLRTIAGRHADKPAVSFTDGAGQVDAHCYGELAERVSRLAGALRARCPEHARVVLMLPSGLDYVAVFCACLEAERVAVPLFPPANKRRPLDRVQTVTQNARPALIVCEPPARGRVVALIAELDLACEVVTVAELETGVRSAEAPAQSHDAIAFLQYTSGSTSAPKGVVVQQRNLSAHLAAVAQGYGFQEDDRMVSWLPLFHDMGLITSVLSALWNGMTCHLMAPHSFVRSPRRWLEALSAHRATISFAPDFAYGLVARSLPDDVVCTLDLRAWRHAACGGEPINAQTVRAFAARFASAGFSPAAFSPSYGQAEAVVCISAGVAGREPVVLRVERAALERGVVRRAAADADAIELVGCGRVIPGHEVQIVDPHTRAVCAPDRAGEIWLRGPSVTGGYFEHDVATAESFGFRIHDGLDGYLRTGDLGFMHEDELVVCGRLKDLIIIAGRNLYPHDLELAASGAAALRRGRVVAFSSWSTALGREALTLVAEVDHWRLSRAQADALSTEVQAAVFEAAECSVDRLLLVKPGTIPLTTSGKLSRRRTRQLVESSELVSIYDSAQHDGARAALRTSPTPAACWAYLGQRLSLLRPDLQLDPEVSLIAHGCDSLTLVALHAELADAGCRVTLAAWFEDRSVRQLSELLAEALVRADADSVVAETARPPLEVETEPFAYAASRAQRRLWFLHELSPDACEHNLVAHLSLTGVLDRAALERSLSWLVVRHSVLRTQYRSTPDGAEAVVQPATPVVVEWQDSSALEPEAALRAAIERELSSPFSLRVTTAALESNAPPAAMRARVLPRGAERADLILAFHHIAFDGRSADLALRGLDQAYRAAIRGEALPPTAGVQYHQLAAAEATQSSQYDEAAALAYFREVLRDLPGDLQLTRQIGESAQRAPRRFRLSRVASDGLVRQARAARTTPFLAALALYALALRQLTGQLRFAVGTDVSGRGRQHAQAVVGFFVNQLVLRCDLEGVSTLSELLARQRELALPAYDHEQLPYEVLVAALRESSPSGSAPFQVKLNYQPSYTRLRSLGDLTLTALELHQQRGSFELVLDLVHEADGTLCAVLEYAPHLPAHFAQRVEHAFVLLVERLGDWSSWPLSDIGEALARADSVLQRDLAREEAAAQRDSLRSGRRRALTISDRTGAEEP